MKKTYTTKRFTSAQHCFAITFFASLLVLFSACTKNDIKFIKVKPSGPPPVWGPTINPQMLAIIEKYESYNVPPLPTLTPAQARMQPSIADAAAAVAKQYNIHPLNMDVDTMGMNIPVDKEQIHVRIYTPPTGKSNYPVIVYYHGGGWVLATIDTYDASCRALSAEADAIVVSVGYRRAPEYTFPVAHNDAYAGYVWTLQNANTFNGDTSRVAVAGESAGGNLACAVSLMARNEGVKLPLHEVLVYPVANSDFNTPSYIKYADAIPLDKPSVKWFFDYYVPDLADRNDPRIALVHADLHNLPPATIIGAQIDPLQSEGTMLAAQFKAAGVPVTHKIFEGVTHEFFGMAAVVPEAKVANALAAAELRKAFHN